MVTGQEVGGRPRFHDPVGQGRRLGIRGEQVRDVCHVLVHGLAPVPLGDGERVFDVLLVLLLGRLGVFRGSSRGSVGVARPRYEEKKRRDGGKREC